jgi:hypothetical protein
MPDPVDLGAPEWRKLAVLGGRLRFLTGTAQYAVERAGHLPPVVVGQVNVGQETTSVDRDGVPYQVVLQRRQIVNDIVDHAFLQDLAQAHVYPGAVIQGRALLVGDIAPIPLARSGGTLNIATDLVTDNPVLRSRKLAEATEEQVTHERRELLKAAAPTDSAGILKAEFQSAQTYREVAVKLGLSISGAAFGIDANATIDSTYKSSTVVAVIRQTYYAATFTPTEPGAEGIWPPEVDAEALVPYCGVDNPPLYIDSVQYGRFICVTVHGAHSSNAISAALKARWTATVSGNVNVDARTKELLDSSEVKIYTIGVPGHSQFERLDNPIDDLDRVFKSGISLNRDNPGAPISFTCRHVLDNTLGHVGLAAMYVQPISAVGADAGGTFQVWDGRHGGLVDTGLRIAPGDYLLIHAWGQIWSGVWLSGTHGPEGWPGHKADPAAPVQSGTAYALVARIGGGQWFEVGSHWEATIEPGSAAAAGNLQLNLNDNNPYNGDTNKRWEVRVEVRRKGAAAAGVYV